MTDSSCDFIRDPCIWQILMVLGISIAIIVLAISIEIVKIYIQNRIKEKNTIEQNEYIRSRNEIQRL